jgi:hypothetical protein
VSNPFVIAPSNGHVDPTYLARLEEGREKLKGVGLGDYVTISWRVSEEFGGGIKSHFGEVTRITNVIDIAPSIKSPGQLSLSVSEIHGVRIERQAATLDPAEQQMQALENPFMQPGLPSHNPFL